MKIVTWNINGIRTFKNGIKKALDSFDADIICVQETKVTRDLLDERTAIVDGYNSYFSFSRGRSGYSGVATFCKDTATPFAAEEGLTGLLTNHGEAIGCYGDQRDFSPEELQLLDNEGRAVITQHKVSGADGPETLTVVNVYCPRADPEKPERKHFKLLFYKLLQSRVGALLGAESHVIVLGDVNTSHRPIDHCDPDDIENFEDNPGRKWLNSFLFPEDNGEEQEQEEDDEVQSFELSRRSMSGGKFVDTFRYFHPSRENAFTCWSTLTGARQTNYGTRIDYIFADRALVEKSFLGADIMPEVEGSDHCPVWACLSCALLPSPRCPALCTRHMPEFVGRQQKLSRFLVKVAERDPGSKHSRESLPGSQEAAEIQENLSPLRAGAGTGQKRASEGMSEASAPAKAKKSKPSKTSLGKPQGSLLAFFKPKPHLGLPGNHSQTQVEQKQGAMGGGFTKSLDVSNGQSHERQSHLHQGADTNNTHGTKEAVVLSGLKGEEVEGQATSAEEEGNSRKVGGAGFWKAVLHGPPPPPLCKIHAEPCVLRTVKKAGPNLGRQFFVCARPQGHASNPQARCNFFAWVEKGK